MPKFDFTKQEIADIKSKIYLSEDEDKILDMRLRNYSIIQIAMKMNMSDRTVNRNIKKIKDKIKRVL